MTVQPSRGSGPELARYSRVTDIHGVNHYPVSLGNPDPNLHEVGRWTDIVSWATPNQAVWTTLGICWRWSYDGFGNYALPTRREQRYMTYDAIINGARSLAFYGGNLPQCWNAVDTRYRWSWTYWRNVLGPLVREIGAISPIAPALVNPATTVVLPTSDPTVQAIARRGAGGDLWVIAAKSGEGTQPVSIGGLPASGSTGEVYTERPGRGAHRRRHHGHLRPLGRARVPLPERLELVREQVERIVELRVGDVGRRPETQVAAAAVGQDASPSEAGAELLGARRPRPRRSRRTPRGSGSGFEPELPEPVDEARRLAEVALAQGSGVRPCSSKKSNTRAAR